MKPDLFQLIDFDRVLFDTSKFVKLLTDDINVLYPGLGTELDERFEEAYKTEETFFVLTYLREKYGDAWLEERVQSLAERYGAEAFMMPGMTERLVAADSLSSHRPSWGILTFGDEQDQRMKLRLVGLESAPIYFTDTPDKAGIITSWQRTDGRFVLPNAFGGGDVAMVSLEDDKLRAFQNMPENALGIWMTAREDAQDVLRANGEVGARMLVAANLGESVEKLRSL
jgi:hypothetical protein